MNIKASRTAPVTTASGGLTMASATIAPEIENPPTVILATPRATQFFIDVRSVIIRVIMIPNLNCGPPRGGNWLMALNRRERHAVT